MSALSNPESYDLVVLGSGEAGKYLAWTLTSRKGSYRSIVIEREYVGGSCPNIACLPSKNFVHSAGIVHNIGAKSGLDGKFRMLFKGEAGTGEVDMGAVRAKKRKMVQGLVEMHAGKFKGAGVELLMGGEGKLVGKTGKVLEVKLQDGDMRYLKGETVIISTGSKAFVDGSIPGLREAGPLTHVEMLEIDVVPEHLLILGGGYIGLEFAQIMRRFGAEVTVIEKNESILKKEDEDVVAVLVKLLEDEGVKFYTSTVVQEVRGRSGDSVEVKGKRAGQDIHISGTHILCATGRIPNTNDIGLEEAGIEKTAAGHVKVDEHLRTAVPGVFAVGDCAGSPHFTHIAFDDFRVVQSFLEGGSRSTKNRQVPYTLFTSLELAHVGLHEHEIKAGGTSYRLANAPMMAFLRTRTLDETRGFAKALIGDDDKILGFTAIGVGAGELLPVVQLAMKEGLPYKSIADLIITHPTLSEGLLALFSGVPPKKSE